MTLIQKLDNEVKEFRTTRALEMVYKSTSKDVGDFGGIDGLIDYCLENGFKDEAVLLKYNLTILDRAQRKAFKKLP